MIRMYNNGERNNNYSSEYMQSTQQRDTSSRAETSQNYRKVDEAERLDGHYSSMDSLKSNSMQPVIDGTNQTSDACVGPQFNSNDSNLKRLRVDKERGLSLRIE